MKEWITMHLVALNRRGMKESELRDAALQSHVPPSDRANPVSCEIIDHEPAMCH